MSYKPEAAGRAARWLCDGAARRAKRTAKKASIRLMRRAAKRDPEDAPTRRIVRGYVS